MAWPICDTVAPCDSHRRQACPPRCQGRQGFWVWQREMRQQNQNSQNEPGMSFGINATKKAGCGRNRLSPASARLCFYLKRALSTCYVGHPASRWLYHIADTRLSVKNGEIKWRTGLEGSPVSAVSRFR